MTQTKTQFFKQLFVYSYQIAQNQHFFMDDLFYLKKQQLVYDKMFTHHICL